MYVSNNNGILTTNAQKRSCAIGKDDDHYGFSEWCYSGNGQIVALKLYSIYGDILKSNDYVVYGEWVGGNIQKDVAISGLPKMFIIFGVKVIEDIFEENDWWLELNDEMLSIPNINVYDVREFGTFEVDIDFENPSYIVPKLQQLTEAVEKECPIGKYFGRVLGEDNTVGEGIVYSHRLDNGVVLRFKVKGDKHQSSKVKKLASVDIEKLNSVKEFVEYAVTESRLNQAAQETLTVHDKLIFDRKKLGNFIKWVSSDIIKEEHDTLTENGLTIKDVGSSINKACREWFFKQENFKKSMVK